MGERFTQEAAGRFEQEMTAADQELRADVEAANAAMRQAIEAAHRRVEAAHQRFAARAEAARVRFLGGAGDPRGHGPGSRPEDDFGADGVTVDPRKPSGLSGGTAAAFDEAE